MPSYDEAYWQERADKGLVHPWGAWLDWEHRKVLKAAVSRVFPRRAGVVIDAGCGSGRWSRWMEETFDCEVVGTDQFEWAGVKSRVRRFVQADAETLDTVLELQALRPTVVAHINSLTCTANWRKAVGSACRLAPLVVAFDNFQTPTPPWRQTLHHRQPIEVPQLVEQFATEGYSVLDAAAGDVLHRRLFLSSPAWAYAAVAVVTAAVDLTVAPWLTPMQAKHSAFLFGRRV